jgi:hypothetical protein
VFQRVKAAGSARTAGGLFFVIASVRRRRPAQISRTFRQRQDEFRSSAARLIAESALERGC